MIESKSWEIPLRSDIYGERGNETLSQNESGGGPPRESAAESTLQPLGWLSGALPGEGLTASPASLGGAFHFVTVECA